MQIALLQGEQAAEAAVPMDVDGKEGDESDAKSMETVVCPSCISSLLDR